jgi:hypothetical protein
VEDDLNGVMPRKTGIFSRIYLLFRAFICFFAHLFASICRVEDDLNGVMPRKTGIFSRILFAFSRLYLHFRAFICFFCRVEDDLNGVMPRTSVELAKLPGVGRYTAAAVGRWN